MPQAIYFDESGFSGNNLLDNAQKYFAYASVATNDDEARDFVEALIKKYGIQSGELKGSKLVRFSRGKKAIDEILDRFQDDIKVSISDKKFALACKLHEYIFEPCFSDINSLFYGVGFHRFIANILYLEFSARGAGADEIFSDFESLMRKKDGVSVTNLFDSSVHPENSPIIQQIREFAQIRADDIRAELDVLDSTGVGKWVLDLTSSALFSLLASWGETYSVITGICDQSKPLQHDTSLFDAMIGRTDKSYIEAFGKREPMTFNLSGPIQFRDSKIVHGIQIADAVAAAAIYVFSGPDDEHSRRWRKIIATRGHYGSIIPDMDEVKLKDRRVQRNAVLLMELHARAKGGLSLTEGMPEYIRFITSRLMADGIRFR